RGSFRRPTPARSARSIRPWTVAASAPGTSAASPARARRDHSLRAERREQSLLARSERHERVVRACRTDVDHDVDPLRAQMEDDAEEALDGVAAKRPRVEEPDDPPPA